MASEPTPDRILLENVRLSFPDIWKSKALNEGDDPKFGAAFLLDKEANEIQIGILKGRLWSLAMEHFGGKEKAKDLIKKKKLNVCLHEGDEKSYDGYDESNMYVSTSSKTRPHVIDRDHSPLAQEDGRPYAGCYVNAAIRLWVQDNSFGKRINAELLGIQFVKDGEPFGAPPFKPEEVFPKLDTASTSAESTGKKADGVGDEDIPF